MAFASTVAMYIILFTKQFPSNGHLLFSLQLPVASTFSVLPSMIFLLWFFITNDPLLLDGCKLSAYS